MSSDWGEIRRQRPYTVHRIPALGPDVDAGAHITALFAQSGGSTCVLLAQGCHYNLFTVIRMAEDNQEIATEGYPTDNALKATLYTRGENEATAINGHNKENIAIKNLIVDGCREEYGWLAGAGELTIVGGWDAKDPVIEHCVLKHPRGWTCCHLLDGSQGGRIVDNEVGPSGSPPPEGPWADGLSIACRNGLIAGNVITDATDGAIVVFCAPGTTVVDNTIIARTRNGLGGINLVDAFPFEGNYTDTRIYNNRILTEGAFIHLAIGIGQRCWGDEHDVQNYGGIVKDNLIGPGRFGYGIAAGSCKDFVVLSNRIAEGTVFAGSMERIEEVSPPCPFLRIDDGFASGTFQSEFVEGPVRYLIGVFDRKGKSVRYHSGALDWRAGPRSDERTQHGVELQDVTWELTPEGRLLVWDQHTPGRVLWDSAGHTRQRRLSLPRSPDQNSHVRLELVKKTGSLRIISIPTAISENKADNESIAPEAVIWEPMKPLLELGYTCPSADPFLTLRDHEPFLTVSDGLNTLWSSQNEWRQFELFPGCFICACPPTGRHEGGMHTVMDALHLDAHDASNASTKPVFLWLDPETSELVLHSSNHPQNPDHQSTIWRSPNWKKTKAEKAVLQTDSNFVIYSKSEGAVWASGTNASDRLVDRVAISMSGSKPALELRNGGKVVWSSRA